MTLRDRFEAKHSTRDPYGYEWRAAEILKYDFLVETISAHLTPGARAVDIGCAQGTLVRRLPQLIALDLSLNALKQLDTPKRLAASSLALPFADASIDLLVLSDGLVSWGLEHPHRVQAVREARRALKPQGRAIFMEYLNPRRHHELTDAVTEGGFTLERCDYLGDRLWYVTESAFRALDGTAVFRAVARSVPWAKTLRRISRAAGPLGSKHFCLVARP